MTLLELTQKILSKMMSDNIDSIADDDEAIMVANEVIDSYLNIFAQTNDSWTKSLFDMEASENTHELLTPSNVQDIDFIKYKGVELTFIEPVEFYAIIDKRAGNVGYDVNGYGLLNEPRYFTSTSHYSLLFDSIIVTDENPSIDLSKVKTYGKVKPTVPSISEIEQSDGFVCSPLPPALFDLLLLTATRNCLARFKETNSIIDKDNASKIFYKTYKDRYRNGYKQNPKGKFSGWGYK